MTPERIEVPMPTSLEVIVYPSTQFVGKWILKVQADAPNVLTGEVEGWQHRELHGTRPSRIQIATAVSSWLRHEVEEQLGLAPHSRPSTGTLVADEVGTLRHVSAEAAPDRTAALESALRAQLERIERTGGYATAADQAAYFAARELVER